MKGIFKIQQRSAFTALAGFLVISAVTAVRRIYMI